MARRPRRQSWRNPASEERLLDPDEHPLLRLAGVGRDTGADATYDPAAEHDRVIAEALWKSS